VHAERLNEIGFAFGYPPGSMNARSWEAIEFGSGI
jgi:hypothetical protein